jgi:hypothetical protein
MNVGRDEYKQLAQRHFNGTAHSKGKPGARGRIYFGLL